MAKPLKLSSIELLEDKTSSEIPKTVFNSAP